jgi:hypothetical protein
VGPFGINVHDLQVCHRESKITVSSRCPDTFDQIVYISRIPRTRTNLQHNIRIRDANL